MPRCGCVKPPVTRCSSTPPSTCSAPSNWPTEISRASPRRWRAAARSWPRFPSIRLSGMDHVDCALMSAYVEMAAGRLDSARSQADALAALPFLREEPHVGWARRIEIDALAGRFDDALAIAESFRAGWVRAGRPRVNNFGPAAHAVAMVHGMRNDDAAREEWIEVTTDVLRSPGTLDEVDAVWPALFDGLLLLHRGDVEGALARMSVRPDELARDCAWHKRLFLAWYAAAWAEASTLGHADDLIDRLQIASSMAQGNAVALLVIDRARLLAAGGAMEAWSAAAPAMAMRFDALGCAYQAERTRRLAGTGDDVLEDPQPLDAGGLGALSPRELEVLRLVTRGRTNPQIASELYISRKTAEHHVSHILTKLDVVSRAEAAVIATRHGLS